MKNILQILGVGFVVYLLSKQVGSSLAAKIAVGSPSIKVSNINPLGLTVNIDLPITNTSPITFPLENFTGQLFYGQYPLADIFVPGPIALESQSTTILPISTNIQFQNLSQQLVSLITDGSWLNSVRIEGVLVAEGLNFPINQPLQLV